MLRLIQLLSVVVAMISTVSLSSDIIADDWTQFRGAGGVSVAPGTLPRSFDDQTNVAWKVPLPAKGASGPIVVGDRVIVTCSGGSKQDELYTVCLDARTGETRWTQKFWATGRCYVHPLSANAAPTPASDGERIFAFYSSNDLACLDLEGNLLWYRGLAVDYPKAGNDVGMASSPVVHGGIVVVQVECQGDSFAMGLDARTGQTAWVRKRDREAVWSSPLVATVNGKAYVMLQSKDSFDVLDLATGEQVFETRGDVSSISSSATDGSRLFAPVDGTTAFAISADGTLNKEWNNREIRPSSMSAILDGKYLYTFNRAGGLFVYDAIDGSEIGKARVLKGNMWSTPVVADDHMYCFTEDGGSYVVDLSNRKRPEVVHSHQFEGEVFLGSPAIADNALYIRSDNFLWKIAEPDDR